MRIVPQLAALVLVAIGGAAPAQTPSALVACAAKLDDAERLACYDAAVAAMGAEARAAIASRQARAAESRAQRAEEERRQVQARVAERERAKRETFGGERLPQAQALAREERLDSLEARVVETLTSSRGQLVFVLDNGQQWRQYEAQSMPPIRANDQVVIQRASLGSYRLVIPRLGRATKVTRDR